MSFITKLIIVTAALFNLLAITSILNGQAFTGLLLQRDRVLSLGDQERKLYANSGNAFDDLEKFERFITEREKLSVDFEKVVDEYGLLLQKSKSLLLPKSHRRFLELEQKFYEHQKENNLITKESRILVNQNMTLSLRLGKAYKNAKTLFDKADKNDFSNLPEMRAQMKQIANEAKAIAEEGKKFEGKSLVKEDIEYYQRYADFYQAWSDYLQYYNVNSVKQNEAVNKTISFDEWSKRNKNFVINQKSYETFIQSFDEKLEKNNQVGIEIQKQEEKEIKIVPFFFKLI